MSGSLWSGWGVRTMSTEDAGYSPLSYHNGTVWPHDNSLIAAGLARYGHREEALRIVRRDARGGRLLRLRAAGGVRRAAARRRRRSRSPTRPPRGRRRGRPARPCCSCRCCSGSSPTVTRQSLVTTVADELPDWVGSLRLSGVPRLRPLWDVAPRGRPRARWSGHDRRSALRIAVISPVWFPVPPTGYGGIEWIVWLLADGLVDAGHDVTLFASGDSHTKAKLASVFPTAPSERIGQTLPELQHCLASYERADEFDVINDHSGLPAAAIGGLIDKPVLHTIHGPLDGEGGAIYEQIAAGRAGDRASSRSR